MSDKPASLGLQRSFNALAQEAQDFDARMLLVVACNQVPGGDIGMGAGQHVIDRYFVERPSVAVAPVVRGDLEALETGFLALLEAA